VPLSSDEISSLELAPGLEVSTPLGQGSLAWEFPSFKPVMWGWGWDFTGLWKGKGLVEWV
jgi:hypothetical protein